MKGRQGRAGPVLSRPLLRAGTGFQQISGVERKFFLIISSLSLVGSVNFSRRQWPELYGNQMIGYLREIKDNWFGISIRLLSAVQWRGFPPPLSLGSREGLLLKADVSS